MPLTLAVHNSAELMAGSGGWGDKTRALLTEVANRGFQLDLFVFVLNLTMMSLLSQWFAGTIRSVSAEHSAGMAVLLALAVAAFLLAPIGATLKRWHYHQRRHQSDDNGYYPAGGCLFNPIFYFCLTALIFASINAFAMQSIYGLREPPGGVFVGSILGGIILMILHTALVYRYFSRPKSAPQSKFLRSPLSGTLGDACLFLNMVLFQLVWNLFSMIELPRPSGFFELLGRTFALVFLALLLYFPPRMFYLAEDIGKRRTWVMILVANLPVLARFLFGTLPGLGW